MKDLQKKYAILINKSKLFFFRFLGVDLVLKCIKFCGEGFTKTNNTVINIVVLRHVKN